jgi:flagellar biosynthesis GTPase FlhF
MALLFFFVIARLHNHFAEHPAQVAATQEADQERLAQAQEANQERLAHEKRLAWQQAHPAEYARQRAEARAAAQRREQQERAEQKVLAAQQAAKAAEDRKQRAAAQAQSANAEGEEQSEVSSAIPSTALVQSSYILNSYLMLVVDRDAWDAMSRQDRKLFFNQVKPIWDSIYAKNHSGSAEGTNVILFDLNGELVATYVDYAI